MAFARLPGILGFSIFVAIGPTSVAGQEAIFQNGMPGEIDSSGNLNAYRWADDFSLSADAVLMGISFWAWEQAVEQIGGSSFLGTVFWQILTNDNDRPGHVLALGLAPTTRTDANDVSDGYNLYRYEFTLPNVELRSDVFWLSLHHGPLTHRTSPSLWWEAPSWSR